MRPYASLPKTWSTIVSISPGFASLVGNYSKDDALLVRILQEAGAVPFVKTNVPQTLMASRNQMKLGLLTLKSISV